MTHNTPSIILASASPRRHELMTQAGFTFQVIPSHTEERIAYDSPEEIVEDLAFQKAKDVHLQIQQNNNQRDYLIIGADTIVSYNGEILGKPKDEQEAFDMLKLLSNRTHQVYTGIALLHRTNTQLHTHLFHEKTDVTFHSIHDYELKEYIQSGDCLDKAGAYGIQGPFAKHIKCIKGDYYNVVGLPIAHLYQKMKSLNLL